MASRKKPKAPKPETTAVEPSPIGHGPPGAPEQHAAPPPQATNGAAAPAHANGASEPATSTLDELQQLEAAVLLGGMTPATGDTSNLADARKVALSLPPGAPGVVLLHCLPEPWRDESAVKLVKKLTDEDVAEILSWIACQWWEGYGCGHTHGTAGHDLRVAP